MVSHPTFSRFSRHIALNVIDSLIDGIANAVYACTTAFLSVSPPISTLNRPRPPQFMMFQLSAASKAGW
jgi:hypothetical protein